MASARKTIDLSPRIERLCWTVFAAVLVCGLLLYTAVIGAVHYASRPAEPQTVVILVPANVGQAGIYPVQLQVVTPHVQEGSDVAAN
jgi:hypothetical protein